MTVLVLHHRGSLAACPYDQWLADYPGDVLLLCSRDHLELAGEGLPAAPHGYRHAEALTGYETEGRLEARVRELDAAYGISHIVNCQEMDLERAAQLREILGLPGQRLDSVVPYRNKLVMKDVLCAAGVPVAAYRAVECVTDVVAFAREHGFPLVVKPRASAGSVDVRIVRSAAELAALLADGLGLYGSPRSSLLVEAFVPGSMFHVDGLAVDGKVLFSWPSEYLFVEAEFAVDRAGRVDVTLDRTDPLAGRLLTFADEVLAALPDPGTFAFHIEVFRTPDDSLVLCEVTCRTGGTAIREVLRGLFEVDINEWWVRASVGLPLPALSSPLTPGPAAGQVFFTKWPGTVRALPGPPPFPWVVKAAVAVRPGQVVRTSAYTSDALAFFVVTAPDRAETERRLRAVETWFLSELVLEPAG